MRLNRPPDAAANDAPAETANPRAHRIRAGLVRTVSVTAVATATCALWALPASASTAAPHVKKHVSATIVSARPSSAWVGAGVRLFATVRSSGRIPTGVVAFRWAGRTLCAGRLSRGSTSCVTRFGGPGLYRVRGFYSGDATHAGSVGATRVSVIRSGTATKITNGSPGIIKVGQSYTFHVTVSTRAGTPAATGTVRLAPLTPPTAPGYTCTATVRAGRGSCTVHPSEYGIDNYRATYGGNAAHRRSASNGEFELAVQNVTTTIVIAPSTAKGSVTLSAEVFAMGANITTAQKGSGSVTFYLSTTSGPVGNVVTDCGAQSLTTFDPGTGNNIATCTGNAELNGLTGGPYYITAVFSGDPVNVKSTSVQFRLTLS